MDEQSGEKEEEEVRNGGTGTRMRLTKRQKELIPDTR